MKYQQQRFTVPASAGHRNTCIAVGCHCGPDARGKCYRCGDSMDSDLGTSPRLSSVEIVAQTATSEAV